MEASSLEVLHTFEFWYHRFRDHAHGTNKVLAGKFFTCPSFNQPQPIALLKVSADNFSIQLNMRPHIAFIRDEMHVPLVFFPTGVTHRPLPLLQDFLGECQAVVVALTVAGRAGIVVPGPGTANVRGFIKYLDRQPSFTHVMNQT